MILMRLVTFYAMCPVRLEPSSEYSVLFDFYTPNPLTTVNLDGLGVLLRDTLKEQPSTGPVRNRGE